MIQLIFSGLMAFVQIEAVSLQVVTYESRIKFLVTDELILFSNRVSNKVQVTRYFLEVSEVITGYNNCDSRRIFGVGGLLIIIIILLLPVTKIKALPF